MKVFVAALAVLLYCANGANAATTIAITTNDNCGAAGLGSSPADNTVEFSCTLTVDDVTNVVQDAGTNIVFKKDGSEVFSIASGTANDATGVALSGSGTTTFATITPASAIDGTNAKLVKVTVPTFPTSLDAQGLYTCEVTDSDTTAADKTEAAGTGADLAQYCSNGATALPAAGLAVTPSGGCSTNVIMTCDTALSLDSVLADSTVRVVFLKGATEAFELAAATTALTSGIAILDSTNFPSTVTFAAVAENGNLKVTITNFPVEQAGADWTCKAVDSTTGAVTGSTLRYDVSGAASSTATLTCGAAISIDACARTMSCTFPASVATLQTDSGIIFFKKAGTTLFQIAAADDAVTSDGSAAVTGVTATAPVGTTTTADSNTARLNFAATATFDSTLDGDWTCEVDATTASNDFVSQSTTISTTCSGAAMNKAVGLLVVLVVTIKTLLF